MSSKSTAPVPADRRAAMIAEAAYFAAEKRNFEPGYELSDWLAAEEAVELSLGKPARRQRKPAATTVAKKPAKKKLSKARSVTRQ